MSKQATILIVEDDMSLQELYQCILQDEAGYTVIQACNGQEALKRLEEHTPHLIILDWLMPVMNGKQFLTEYQGDVPVLVIAATSTFKPRAMALGARDFITKPFDMDKLLARVEELLGQTTTSNK